MKHLLRRKCGPQSRLLGDVATLALMVGLLSLVYLLPADTSLSQVKQAGRLTACVPPYYPPLVTNDPDRPGYDVELLQEIAARLGVAFSANTNSAIGRDFNPRNWRVTRAQCEVLAGGVVLSTSVRSFLSTVPTQLHTGWMAMEREGEVTLRGASVGVFAGLTGLDRIGLARFLRESGASVDIVQSQEALAQGLQTGAFEVAITEALLAQQMAARWGWSTRWVPAPVERYALGMGLWRGDLTLIQAIEGIMQDLDHEGFMAELAEKYSLETVS